MQQNNKLAEKTKILFKKMQVNWVYKQFKIKPNVAQFEQESQSQEDKNQMPCRTNK